MESCRSPFQTKTEAFTVVLGFVVALTCGAPNAWYLTSGKMQDDLSLSDSQMNIITSVGLVGLYFTFLAGLIYDSFGVSITVFVGGLFSSLGYIIMSFGQSSTWLLILFAFMAVGFGCGATFISVLGFGLKVVKRNPGFAVSVIGGGMSLSLAFVSIILATVTDIECTTLSDGTRSCPDSLWRTELRTLAIVIFVVCIPSSIAFYFLDRRSRLESSRIDVTMINSESGTDSYDNVPILSSRDSSVSRKTSSGRFASFIVTTKEMLSSLMNVFFVVTDLSYMVGVGGGLVAITQLGNIWDEYTTETPARNDWVFYISTFFSIFNCFIGGILFGAIADACVSRGIPRVRAIAVVFFISSFVFVFISGLCLIAFPNLPEQIMMMILLMLVGIPFGSSVTAFPTIIGEYYNIAHFGAYLGIYQIGVAGVTFLVPVYCTSLSSSFGNFSLVFSTFALYFFLSAFALFFVRVPPMYSAKI